MTPSTPEEDDRPDVNDAPSPVSPAAPPRAGFWRTFLKAELAMVRVLVVVASPFAAAALGFLAGLLLFTPRPMDWEGTREPALDVLKPYAAFLAFLAVAVLPIAAAAGLVRRIDSTALRGRPWSWLSGRKRKRRLTWLVGPPILAAAAGALAAGLLVRWVEKRLDAAMTAASLDDPTWRLDDILASREQLPEDDNAAFVANEASMLLPERWPWGPERGPGLPGEMLPEPRRILDALNAAELNRRVDGETLRLIRAVKDEFTEALEVARELADYDRGSHTIVIGPMVILDTLLPETSAARGVAYLLQFDAEELAAEGLIDEALDSCRAILVTARSIGDEPFAISQLSRNAIGRSAVRTVQRVLGQGEASEEALERLQDLVLTELDEPSLMYGLRGERAGTDEWIRRLQDGEIGFSEADNAAIAANPGRVRLLFRPWTWAFYTLQRALELELLNDIVAIGQSPPVDRPRRWAAFDADLLRLRDMPFGRTLAAIPVYMTPALRSFERSTADYKAELAALAVLTAAERQRLVTGSWPAGVDAIDPEILADPPLDPFVGRPLRMGRADGRVRVSSAGANGVDDQGAFEPYHDTKGGPDDAGASAWDVELRERPPEPAAAGTEGGADGDRP